jgi:hypothetical protein
MTIEEPFLGHGWSVRQGVPTLLHQESNQLFYVYTGKRGRLMGSPVGFMTQTRLLERNVVFLSDPHGSFYADGVSADLDDYDKVVAWQRDLRRELTHVERSFCLGTSMGGYAALLFGYLLEVEEVWAFSPLTIPTADVCRRVPPERADLAVLLRTPNGRTRYNVYYNQNWGADAIAAGSLAECEGVRLCPQEGEGHNVVQTLLERRLLGELIVPPTPAAR